MGPERARAIALVCVADTLVAVSFGAIAVGGGLDRWVPVVLSLLVFAGGAQFAAVGTVLAGGSATAAVVTGLLLNARLLPFSFSVSDVIRGGPLRRALGAQIVTDETVALAMAERDPVRRVAVFWACGVALFVCWNIGVAAGAVAGTWIGDTDALGLDAAFPAVLVAIVLPALSTRRIRSSAGIGSLVAVLSTPLLPAGLPVLASLAGLVALVRRPDQTCPDRARLDQTRPDQACLDQARLDRARLDRARPDRACPDHICSDQASLNQARLDQTCPDHTCSDQAHPDRARPAEPADERP